MRASFNKVTISNNIKNYTIFNVTEFGEGAKIKLIAEVFFGHKLKFDSSLVSMH